MAQYDFHYLPLEGKITGKQVLEQTQDAINDLGNRIVDIETDTEAITEAVEIAQDAKNTADNAETIANDAMDVAQAERESAQEAAQEANQAATNAANSASSASTTATQLMEYLATKEEITAPAVDPTLTISGAAADAQIVGNAITDTAGASLVLSYNQGKYCSMDVDNDTIDITNIKNSVNFRLYMLDCSAGDTFTVTGRGTTQGTRLWIFAGAESGGVRPVIAKEITGDVRHNYVITAPTGAEKLIINADINVYPNPFVWNGVSNQKRVAENTEFREEAEPFFVIDRQGDFIESNKLIVGRLNTGGTAIRTQDTSYRTTDFIRVYPGEVFYCSDIYNGAFEGSRAAIDYAFYKESNMSYVIGSATYTAKTTIPVPNDAKYMRVSIRTTFSRTCLTTFKCESVRDMPDFAPSVKQSNYIDINFIKQKQYNLSEKNGFCRSIAHQGYKKYTPKSTEWSYKCAKLYGYVAGENDVRKTSDNVLVMWHDAHFGVVGDVVDADHGYELYVDAGGTNYYWYDASNDVVYDLDYNVTSVSVGTLTRVNGSDLTISTTSWDVIKNIDVGAYYYTGTFAGTHVQTFEDWTILMKRLGLEMYIHQKIPFQQETVTILRRHNMLDRASWVISTIAGANNLRSYDANARILFIDRLTGADLTAAEQFATTGRGAVYFLQNDIITDEVATEAFTYKLGLEAYYVQFGTNHPTLDEAYTEIRRLVDLGCTGMVLDEFFVSDAYKSMYNDLLSRLPNDAVHGITI